MQTNYATYCANASNAVSKTQAVFNKNFSNAHFNLVTQAQYIAVYAAKYAYDTLLCVYCTQTNTLYSDDAVRQFVYFNDDGTATVY